MEDFDPLHCPLQGAVFIEASAGTGKTHSITSLVLRLILEERQDLGRLLLVTYTNAATDELRRKTRHRLSAALTALEMRLANPAAPAADPLVEGLIAHHRVEPATAALRLRQALLQFDDLSVLTIHSFCQRVLRDRAFESGQLFNTELEPDETALIQETVLDFWRTLLPRQQASFFTFLHLRGRGLEDLVALSRTALSRADAAILPRAEASLLRPYEITLRESVAQAAHLLANESESILQHLNESALDARVYQQRRLHSWLDQIARWLQDDPPLPSQCPALARFTNDTLKKATRSGSTPPSHEFFDLCDQLQDTGGIVEDLLERQWIQVKRDLLGYLHAHLPARKKERNRYAYDDLLHNTLGALAESATGLANDLARQYPVILIDEFQDTDPIQYGIFQHLHESPHHALLCLIGDPKQAIYAFRGGDIFTYTHARSRADYVATLSENWRSSETLVRAINTLYQAGPRPFWTPSIQYRQVRAANVPDGQQRSGLQGEDTSAPLQIWQLSGKQSAYLTEQGCLEATCQEIARLVQGGIDGTLEVDGRPLQPSDIAILVRWHYQAPPLQARLQELGIRTVSYDRQHIFQTQEARNLEVFLLVMAYPRDENALKALLLSELMAYQESDLEAALTDAGRWGSLLESMASYRMQWKNEGFIVMFRRFLRQEHLPQRLLAMPHGERRLTNLLQLSELTEEAQAAAKFGIHATLQWYRQQRYARLSEEKELRLESDDDRVKILTIHRSKGLEFPLVFLPFAWSGSPSRRRPDHVAFHRPEEDGFVRCVDVGSKDFDANLARAREEEAAEELRMLYVALTRAQHRVYVLTVPDSPKYQASSLAYLWHHRESDLSGPMTQLQDRLSRLSVARFREDYVRMVGSSQGAISLRTWEGRPPKSVTVSEEPEPGVARQFTGRVASHWGITSYSQLAGHRDSPETPDRDTGETFPLLAAPRAQLEGMAALPRGKGTGNMLHLLYENLSFTADETAVRREATLQLVAQGMSVDDWLDLVTAHTLDLFRCDLGGFALCDVADQDRLAELAFHFPIGDLTPGVLQAFLEENGRPSAAAPLDFHRVEGFLKGFIDLVFRHRGRYFILDYKSNFLGAGVEAYESDHLPAVMRESHYDLQYYLYAAALHRYLGYRMGAAYDYQSHFGGVYYLFVRGMTPDTSPVYGVFHDRPDQEAVESLSAMLSELPSAAHA